MKKVAVIGSGKVGEVLADGFLKHGYSVIRASRDPQKMVAWKNSAGANAELGTVAEAASAGEIIVLAVKGSAAELAIDLAGVASLADKTIIDPTNPISDAPPQNGVIAYFTGPNESLMERLQKKAPKARFVKAFSSVGSTNFVNPNFGSQKPTMFICGNHAGAKSEVTTVLSQFGWESADMGGVTAARAIEPLCMLWCIPGFQQNSWTHAFKLLKR